MSEKSSPVYRFGDLLALVREYWVRDMVNELTAAGFSDYRRSDAALVRLLMRGPLSVGRIGAGLEISRQAARKLVSGLEQRGYASTATSPRDARQLDVSLTARGEEFGRAIVAAVGALNQRLADRLTPAQLRAADAALRAALPDDHALELAARLIPAPPDR